MSERAGCRPREFLADGTSARWTLAPDGASVGVPTVETIVGLQFSLGFVSIVSVAVDTHEAIVGLQFVLGFVPTVDVAVDASLCGALVVVGIDNTIDVSIVAAIVSYNVCPLVGSGWRRRGVGR